MRSGAIQTDFTQGSIPKQLVRFAVPFMLSNAMQLLYSLVDMVVVGKYVGSFGLSAVSNASQIVQFCTMLCLGFCTGGQVLIAQCLGAGRRDRLGRVFGTLCGTVAALGAVMTLLLLALRRQVLRWVSVPPEAEAMAGVYLLICGGGLLFTFGYNMVSAALRGMGDSFHPFLFICIASVVNLLLDVLFTGLLRWGVAGAAAATVLGQAASLVFSLRLLYRRREEFGFDFHPRSFRPDRESLRALVSLGIPYAVQSSAVNISMIFVNRLINGVGVYASAAFGVGVKLDDIASKLTQGIMYAVSPMVGQNAAARKWGRTRKIVLWALAFSSALYLAFTVLYLRCAVSMFSVFNTEPEVLALAPVFVSAVVWGFPAMAVMRASGGFVQGIGYARMSMVLGILDGVVCRIGLSWLLGTVCGLGFYGFVLGFGLAAYSYGVPSLIYFLSGQWKKRKMLVT